MVNSTDAIHFVLDNEGGYSDNVADPGGATNYGISLRFLRTLSAERLRRYGIFTEPAHLTAADMEKLTKPQAVNIYQGEFWNMAPFDRLDNQQLADYIFDMAVNHGLHMAVKLVQRAIWGYYGKIEYAGLHDDGILGDATLSELEALPVADFLPVLATERAGYMRFLAETTPRGKEFLTGWLKRCYRY